jgi:XTP/dITP diphosphohydrolase
MTQLWISTTNQGKLSEFKNILGDRVEIHSVAELGFYSAPPETGTTFVDNARIKAKTLKALRPGVWIVADDSGLEAEGLNGMPGVHSARYAGDKAGDAENVAKLLKMIQIRSAGNRKAQMTCVLVAYDPNGQEHVIQGVVKGQLATTARGKTGFGYDPVFIPEGQDKTYAELGAAVKNQTSHRSQAIRQLLRLIHPD